MEENNNKTKIMADIFLIGTATLFLVGIGLAIAQEVNKNKQEVPTPIMQLPYNAIGTGSTQIELYNNCDSNISIYDYRGSYQGSIGSYSSDVYNYTPTLNVTHFSNDSSNDMICLCDFVGFKGYGADITITSEYLGTSNLRFYDTYAPNMYLDFNNKSLMPNSPFGYYLLGSASSTQPFYKTDNIYIGTTFKLNFKDSHNLLNDRVFDHFKYYYQYQVSESSSKYYFMLSAVTSNNYEVQLLSNLNYDKLSEFETSNCLGCFPSNIQNNLTSYYSSNNVYFAPYMLNNQIKGVNYIEPSDNNAEFIAFMNKNNTPYIILNDNGTVDSYSDSIWNGIGNIIRTTFVSFLPFASIVILPGVTIGALIFVPLIVAFIVLLINLLKKG